GLSRRRAWVQVPSAPPENLKGNRLFQAIPFFLVRPAGRTDLVVQVHDSPGKGKSQSNGKGFAGDCESGGSRRQSAGLTNKGMMSGLFFIQKLFFAGTAAKRFPTRMIDRMDVAWFIAQGKTARIAHRGTANIW
ncbi:MAG TPA: hypothetical protein P5238_02395, partial [Smithellaceae bacterium]|nr:hypothetical protein [Smithellaceae bacterium]HRV43837.1 hypothetical protein [Smithellaceae bacterium]